jgi:hypothetical protein
MTLACVAGPQVSSLLTQVVCIEIVLSEHGFLPQPRSQTHKPDRGFVEGAQTPRKLQAAQLPAVSHSVDGVHWARASPASPRSNTAAARIDERCSIWVGTVSRLAPTLYRLSRLRISPRLSRPVLSRRRGAPEHRFPAQPVNPRRKPRGRPFAGLI